MTQAIKNRITGILGTAYPLIQGPMRMITLGEMAAAVSNSGGFGQIAASGLSGEQLRKEIKKARELTDRPFGVNIPIHRPNALEALEIAIKMGVETITTSGGNPAVVMEKIKKAGLKVLHKVSTVEMAQKAEAAGVDGVIATGYEAGGHLGRTDATAFCLVPQLVDILKIPVVAAGGVADGRGLLAALVLGAEGVEIGTRFLATRECPVPDFFKQLILEAKCESTLVLGKEKMMPVRVLKSAATEMLSQVPESKELDEKGEKLYSDLLAQAIKKQEQVMFPCGQSAGLCKEIKNIGEIFPQMMAIAKALSKQMHSLFKEVGQ